MEAESEVGFAEGGLTDSCDNVRGRRWSRDGWDEGGVKMESGGSVSEIKATMIRDNDQRE